MSPSSRARARAAVLVLAALPLVSTASRLQAQQASPALRDALGIERGTVQTLVLPGQIHESFELRIVVGSTPYVLDLRRHDVRAPGYRLFVDDGVRVREVASAAPSTFQGTVRGIAASSVAATVHEGRVQAFVRLGGTGVFAVQAADLLDPALQKGAHVAFWTSANRALRALCGVTDDERRSVRAPRVGVQSSSTTLLAEIAADADFDFYKNNGSSVPTSERQIAAIVNAVNVIYKRDVELDLRIRSTMVRTTATYSSTDARQLLTEFANLWNRNHRSIPRDLAHLFSGKGSFDGILGNAELGTVCVATTAYGVSRVVSQNLTQNVALVAHQIAHNFDALHCDSKASCNLMCSSFGGCSKDLGSFAADSKAVIIKFKNGRPCLTSATPPAIQSITPSRIQAFGAPTILISGLRFRGASEVEVGTTKVTTFSATDTTIQFQMPPIDTVGVLPVRVVGPAGPSNSVNLVVDETKPPVLTAPSIVLGGFPMLFSFGAGVQTTWILVVSPNAQTLRFAGTDVLRDLIPLQVGVTNGAGLGNYSIRVPTGLKGRMWSQLLTDKGGLFDGASPILGTTFF